MPNQLTVRDVPPGLHRRLVQLSRARGESMNATIRAILERAVGTDGRRQQLDTYTTWSADDHADFDRVLCEQRAIDADLWR